MKQGSPIGCSTSITTHGSPHLSRPARVASNFLPIIPEVQAGKTFVLHQQGLKLAIKGFPFPDRHFLWRPGRISPSRANRRGQSLRAHHAPFTATTSRRHGSMSGSLRREDIEDITSTDPGQIIRLAGLHQLLQPVLPGHPPREHAGSGRGTPAWRARAGRRPPPPRRLPSVNLPERLWHIAPSFSGSDRLSEHHAPLITVPKFSTPLKPTASLGWRRPAGGHRPDPRAPLGRRAAIVGIFTTTLAPRSRGRHLFPSGSVTFFIRHAAMGNEPLFTNMRQSRPTRSSEKALSRRPRRAHHSFSQRRSSSQAYQSERYLMQHTWSSLQTSEKHFFHPRSALSGATFLPSLPTP